MLLPYAHHLHRCAPSKSSVWYNGAVSLSLTVENSTLLVPMFVGPVIAIGRDADKNVDGRG